MTAALPFLLDEDRLSPGQKMAREQGNAFNQPRTEPQEIEPRLLWQQKDQARQDSQEDWLTKNRITPIADTITPDQFTDRNGPIQSMGQSATAGAVASANYQRQMQEAAALRSFQDQQTQAMLQAYSQYNGIAGSMRPKINPTGTLSYNAGGQVNWDGSDVALADMMRKAGFPEDQIGIGMAIARGESGWNAQARHSNSNGSIDQGIFQINSIHKARYAGMDIFDPQTNVNIAYQVWKDAGGSWRPWVVYQTGKYRQYLGSVPQTRLIATPGITGGPVTTGNGTIRNQIIQAAMPVLNLPYVWGGNSMRTGVDCSGLIQQVYKQVLGWNTPRQSRAQAVDGAIGRRVGSVNQLRPGDLVAFQWAGGWAGPNVVSHIAIYMGNNQIIESYGPNGVKGRIRSLGNSAQDRGAIYLSVKMPGE